MKLLIKAKHDELMASKLLNENEKRRLATIFGVTDANTKQASSYGLLKGSMKSFTQVIKEAWDATEGMGGSLKRVGGTVKNLWNDLPKEGKIAVVAAIVAAINGVMTLIFDTTEKIKANIEESKAKIESTTSELSSIESQIQENADKISRMKEAGADTSAYRVYEMENEKETLLNAIKK